MDNKGGGIGILLLVGVVAMALMGRREEAEAVGEEAEVPVVTYPDEGTPIEASSTQRVSTPADVTMRQKAVQGYAMREAEALAKANAEAMAVVAEQKARGLSVAEMADEDAMDALARAAEAEATGDLSVLGYWASGYTPNTSKADIIKDVKKAAESHLVVSKTQKKITEAIKAGGKAVVTDEEVAASKGTMVKDPKTGKVYAAYSTGYGVNYIQIA